MEQIAGGRHGVVELTGFQCLFRGVREYAVFTHDTAGRILSWNEGVEKLFGYPEGEWLGRGVDTIMTTPGAGPSGSAPMPDMTARIAAALGLEREVGAPRSVAADAAAPDVRGRSDEVVEDVWMVRRDGSRVWCNSVTHSVRDAAGEPVGYLRILRDQSEKRETQLRLGVKRQLLTAVVDSLPGAFFMFDGERYLMWNREMERATGLSPEEMGSAGPADVALEAEAILEHVEEVFKYGHGRIEVHLRGRDGSLVPYLFHSHAAEVDGSSVIVGLGLEAAEQVGTRQLLERVALEQAVLAELAATTLSAPSLQQVFDLAANRVADTLDADHVHIVELVEDSSRAGPEDELIEGRDGTVYLERARAGNLSGRGPIPGASRELNMRSGLNVPVRGLGTTPFGHIAAVSEREAAFAPEDATFLRSVAHLLAGAVERARLYQELERRAENDDLTGLLKRAAFERRVVEALARAERQGTKVALLFVDLDDFKEVNDSLGHQAGDEVLVEVARRLRETVRAWDVVCRQGGDEFVVCLPDLRSVEEVTHVAERLLEAFRVPFTTAGESRAVGATVGIATYPDDGLDVDALLSAADEALYEGKSGTKHTFAFYRSRHGVN